MARKTSTTTITKKPSRGRRSASKKSTSDDNISKLTMSDNDSNHEEERDVASTSTPIRTAVSNEAVPMEQYPDSRSHPSSADSRARVDLTAIPDSGDISITRQPYINVDSNGTISQRAESLTKVSGLEPGSPAALQLLLKSCEVSGPLKKRKKKTDKNVKKITEKQTIPTSSRGKDTEDSMVPFWLTSPKNVEEIPLYTKTLCSRLSQIEKQMKHFETERQGLLNALYQVNFQQLQGQSKNAGSSANKDNVNVEPTAVNGNEASVLTETTTVIKVTETNCETTLDDANSDKNPVEKSTKLHQMNSENDEILTVDHKTDATIAVNNDTETSVPSDIGIANAHQPEHKDDNKATHDIEVIDLDAEDEQEVQWRTPKSAMRLPGGETPTVDDNQKFDSPIEELSQSLHSAIHHLNCSPETDLEFVASTQLDHNVVDYNAGVVEEPTNGSEFKMWRSCWLKPTPVESPMSPLIIAKRSPARSRALHQSTDSWNPSRDKPNDAEKEEPDILECFWNMDFKKLSKHRLTMLVQFFGMKGNLNLKCQIDEMEKIRSYLSDYRVK